jgi:hypothetical protein
MPGLGTLTDEDFVRHARQTQGDGKFRRHWLNQWTTTDERLIPDSAWSEVLTDQQWPNDGLVFCADITLDRSRASIVVADKHGVVELVQNDDGTEWVPGRLVELAQKHGGRVVLDGYGPAGNLVDMLDGVEVVKYGTRDCVSAASAFYDSVMQGAGIAVRPHDSLNVAVASAQRKTVGSGWLFARTDPAADLSPLHATTLAFHCAKFRPKRQRKPVIF